MLISAMLSFDLDQLAEIINGQTGLSMQSKQESDPFRQEPDIGNVLNEEETETPCPPLTVGEAFANICNKEPQAVDQTQL